MSKVIVAEYDAEHQTLKLREPLEGVEDRGKVRVAIEEGPRNAEDRPWMKYEGSLSPEAGRQLAEAIREAFGRNDIEV